MNEIVFIKENKGVWQKLISATGRYGEASTAELIELYEKTADDLSYARTHYPDSEIVTYLNAITLNAHRSVYKSKFGDRSAFIRYWTTDIPLAIYRQRNSILLAFAIFIGAILIGWFSSATDSHFVRLIMGDSYVNMTLENIDKGDPMAVYDQVHQSKMFLGIGVNNIRVAFMAFMFGILTPFFTSIILLMNGIMVGAFFYFFYEKGIAALAWSTIMIHGTLELSAIAIAGGAGIVLGNSLLFPGTYSRMTSLVTGAKEGIKIMMGLVPVFIAAAFLESYLTREYLELGMTMRVAIIILSLVFLIWFFIYYSKKVYERTKVNRVEEVSGFRLGDLGFN